MIPSRNRTVETRAAQDMKKSSEKETSTYMSAVLGHVYDVNTKFLDPECRRSDATPASRMTPQMASNVAIIFSRSLETKKSNPHEITLRLHKRFTHVSEVAHKDETPKNTTAHDQESKAKRSYRNGKQIVGNVRG